MENRMPITVTTSEGVLDDAAERTILPRLTESLLARHGLTDNDVLRPIVVGSVHVLPSGRVFSGSLAQPAIFVELKVPSMMFATKSQRQGFVDDVNAILNDVTHGKHAKERTFVNITYAVAELADAVGSSASR